MAKSVEALVNSELLRWARKTAGFDIRVAAKKAQVIEEALESWERGESRPSIAQTRKLGRVYKRPIAAFYLPEPPRGFTVPKDYRRPDGSNPRPPSPELLFEVRQAHSRREVLVELIERTEGTPFSLDIMATMNERPDEVADRLRTFLGVSFEDQHDWNQGYDTMNRWRAKLERAGILVFQMSNVPWIEARGFSVNADNLPLVVVNAKDAPNGRTFTMLHELTHLALRQGGICDLAQHELESDVTSQIEVFCNAVAAAVLIPRRVFLEDPDFESCRSAAQWTDGEIASLARKFHCSREVALRRLLTFRFLSPESHRTKSKQLREQYASEAKPDQRGFQQPAQKTVSSLGHFYVRVLLNSFYEDYITGSDLADFLEVRLKHLPRVEAILSKSPI